MKTEDFNYDLPEELIAQVPIENREQSRLLVMDKKTGEIEHRHFLDIVDYLDEGDCLILNNTRVLPARLFGNRKDKDEKIEILLLKRVEGNKWETLVRPGKKVRPGNTIYFGDGILKGEVISIEEEGTRIIDFIYDGIFEEVLDELGEMPLPPYIKERLEEKERYQTVYSKHNGSAAAPTAGLHFTKDLLEKIEKKNIKIGFVTLHVGLGTFRPVKVDNVKEHHMHSEYYEVDSKVAKLINETKRKGGKVVSVGTTTTRTLEAVAKDNGEVVESSGWTDIFIYPGFEFKVVDNLITNFHLPESTLLMLVSALSDKEKIMKAYEIAVEEKYRFFSFGDAMFIK